jgi:poly-gamma-glutamate synthesis protein (capsule biosynthesis protein)
MSILILGDVASPDAHCSAQLGQSLERSGIFTPDKAVLANLEGMIANIGTDTPTPVLFNHPSVLDVLKKFNVKAVSLANNHTLDLPEHLRETTAALESSGVAACGAGEDMIAANAPARFEHEGKPVLVFAWCWDILLQHQSNPSGGCQVNELHVSKMLQTVREARLREPDSIIILKLHWSFDLETRPFPLYRKLSRALIDAGADVIAGCHSHCVQGGERYKNGIIVYGLGNFFIPWHTFINGTIHFPEFARDEIALDWDPVTRKATCHWFRYDEAGGAHRLDYLGEEDFDNGSRILEYSPYRDMDSEEYLDWFSEHRRKRKLMPIYRDPCETIRNAGIDTYLKARIRFARFLARTGLRGWNN